MTFNSIGMTHDENKITNQDIVKGEYKIFYAKIKTIGINIKRTHWKIYVNK